jgi:hypothetical protein
MPRYIFAIRAGDGDAPERAAELSDDAAAFAYACEIVRERSQFAGKGQGRGAPNGVLNSLLCGVRVTT